MMHIFALIYGPGWNQTVSKCATQKALSFAKNDLKMHFLASWAESCTLCTITIAVAKMGGDALDGICNN